MVAEDPLAGAIAAYLDALICPSVSTIHEHARRGSAARMTHLPYFLPEDYTGLPEADAPAYARPYVAAAGRLEEIKGFQDVIDAMRKVPGLDLRIAGSGQYEAALRDRRPGLCPTSISKGVSTRPASPPSSGGRAVVVPSLVYETFGYVVLEAFAEGTPVIVRNLGRLARARRREPGRSGLRVAGRPGRRLGRLAVDDELRDSPGADGLRARREVWSEAEHLDRYFALIDDRRQRPPVPARTGPSRRAFHAPSGRPRRSAVVARNASIVGPSLAVVSWPIREKQGILWPLPEALP